VEEDMGKVVMKKSRLLRKIVMCRLLGVILTFIGTASAFVAVFAKDGTPLQTITTAAIVAVVAFVCGVFFLQMGGCQIFSGLTDVRPVIRIANLDFREKTRM
jgi:peptidoglycan/LPS O-acetylase OafA/YrhL